MNGILKCSGVGIRKNIGDYIQSVAQEQFWSHYECFVERESLNTFESEEPVNVIMNAWFMRNPKNFPPAPCINPLFVSFHIVPRIAESMLTPETVAYLKKYEPIGARDVGTCDLLLSKGVKSYFSGCLTLTLGLKYLSKERNNQVYFVDPYFEIGGNKKQNKVVKYLMAVFYYLKYRRKIKKFAEKFQSDFRSIFHRWSTIEKKIMAASFYHSYSNLFSDEVLFNAVYLTHSILQSDYPTEDAKMLCARKLVTTYSSAKYVVTSRIHCALPCLGVETPVLFVTSDALNGDSVRSFGRFGGLVDLLHVAKWTPNGVFLQSEILRNLLNDKKIDNSFNFTNLEQYKILKHDLIQSIKSWQKRFGMDQA